MSLRKYAVNFAKIKPLDRIITMHKKTNCIDSNSKRRRLIAMLSFERFRLRRRIGRLMGPGERYLRLMQEVQWMIQMLNLSIHVRVVRLKLFNHNVVIPAKVSNRQTTSCQKYPEP